LRKLNIEPSIGASHQISVHLAKQFQRRFLEIKPCLLQHPRSYSFQKISRPPFDYLLWRRSGRFCQSWSHANNNCLWQPCLLTDRDEISNLYRAPSIDAFYLVSVQLAKQWRRILEIDQSETRIASGGHDCQWIGSKWAIFIENLP
jgi:hypothetical protein